MANRTDARSLAALILLCAAPALAEPKVEVPAPLVPWVPWVLADVPDHACAFDGERALCHWPGKLVLDLGAQGGRFEQQVLVDRLWRLALPGSRARWPLLVRVDGHELAVLDQDGVPSVEVPAGAHRIEGRFEWKALPERLELPGEVAAVALRVNGKPVAFPKRDEHGQLWLQGGPSGDVQNEQLGVSVTRKLEDGVPFITTTRIKLRVSGRAREVSLGQVLLLGMTPLSIQSELPARLEEGGELRLQVRAGTYAVEVRARSDAPPEQLAFRKASSLWPKSEVWVWQADEAQRQVQLSGAPAVEPSRTELDPDWRNLPAFSVHEGTALKFATTRRGEPSPPPNRLALERELWLDLDGRGYTIRDHISTELQQGFRLELLAGQLGHVAADGEDLLITRTHPGKPAGVELRKQKQALLAEWRYERKSLLPAVAWSEDVQSLSATLHLGPGFRLLAARGVDTVSETWLQAWDLFDFFFVLLVALAVGRLVGRAYALLALAALALCHGEEGAPQASWFALLAFVALLRVLPAGWFRNLMRVGYVVSVATLLVIAVPFVVDQVRVAIYPQLAQPWSAWAPGTNYSPKAMMAPATPPPDAYDTEALEQGTLSGGAAPASLALRKSAPSRSYAESKQAQTAPDGLQPVAQRALQQDPEATVQTGPGVPTWSFRSWTLRWSGPVDKAHQLELYLLSPIENRVLGFLRVILLAGLLIALLRAATPGRDRPARSGAGPTAPPDAKVGSAAAAVLLACVAFLATWLMAPPVVHADLPDQALLDKLRERLVKPADCRPGCVSIDELRIAIDDRGLVMSLSVHAAERTSVRLPGPAASFVPAEVMLDHHADAPMILLEDGFLHVRVEPGVHLIEARGPLPTSDTLTLSFGDRPHRARAQAVGWKIDGVREDGSVEAALALSRVLSVTANKTLENAALPPFLALEREIELGPSWEVHSTLRRVSPTGSPILVRVPLLAGESVTESSLEVEGGELHVAFGRDEQVVEWRSRLNTSDRIELRAEKGRPWSERWRLLCGPIWRCEVQGLTPVYHVQGGRWQPELVPWPGETARIVVSRPEPAAGQSLTIDAADLELTPGARMLKASLELRVRSSRGATQALTLPPGARVQQLSIDGQERSVHVEGRTLAVTLGPGTHAVKLQWQERTGMALVQRGPELRLGKPAANASVRVHVPDDRWLLWLSGPSWGPAILFWGYLLVVLGAAIALGRVRHSPLRTYQWMLLGSGLTQIPAPASLCIVGWFFAMAYRARMPEQRRWPHNLVQLGLVGWTLAALGCLYFAVQTGLLVRPDMQVMGANSDGTLLRWYLDRSDGVLPTPTIVSVPLWAWRLSMLGWSLWLAARLVGWLPWAFGCFKQGALWKKSPPRPPRPRPPVPPATPPATPLPAPVVK